MCITETWLTNVISDPEIIPSNYTIYRNDRNTRGGGVLIAISNSIPSKLYNIHNTVELITIELIINPPTILCCLYIPPNSSQDYYDDTLHYFRSLPTNMDLIILGDLNSPDINWLSMVGHSHSTSDLCNEFFNMNLTRLVSEPTHIHGNILDIIATNASHRISNIITDSRTCRIYSDHFLILFNLKQIPAKKATLSTYQLYDFNRADLESLDRYLLDHDLIPLHIASSNNIDLLWTKFLNEVSKGCKLYIPTIRVSSSPSPRWFNPEIRDMLNQARTLRRSLRRKHTGSKEAKLAMLESSLEVTILQSKQDYEVSIIEAFSSNPKKLYNHLKMLRNSNFVPDHLIENETLVCDPLEKADLFNKFFNSVFTRSSFTLPPTDQLPTPVKQLSSIEISSSDVYRALV